MSRGGATCSGRGSSLRPVVPTPMWWNLAAARAGSGSPFAGEQLRITGTDFSASQIALARENAARKRLDAFTHYQVATSGVWPSLDRAGTGVLIHAFLHHLDGAELDAFFEHAAPECSAGDANLDLRAGLLSRSACGRRDRSGRQARRVSRGDRDGFADVDSFIAGWA